MSFVFVKLKWTSEAYFFSIGRFSTSLVFVKLKQMTETVLIISQLDNDDLARV